MHIRGRHEWRAEPPKTPLKPLTAGRVTDIFIHHTTGAQQPDIQPWLRSIQRFHQQSRGWNDIGYSYIVDRNGTVWEGRGRNVGAHTKGHNSTGLGIAYLGDGSDEVPVAALRSVKQLVEMLSRDFPITTVRGHRDVGRTACPGDWLYGWVMSGMPVLEVPKRRVVPDLREGYRRLGRLRGWRS